MTSMNKQPPPRNEYYPQHPDDVTSTSTTTWTSKSLNPSARQEAIDLLNADLALLVKKQTLTNKEMEKNIPSK